MKQRYLTAAVVVPIFSLIIEFGPAWLYGGIIVLVGALGLYEALGILRRAGFPVDIVPAVGATMATLIGAFCGGEPGLAGGLTGGIILTGVWSALSRREPKESLTRLLPTVALAGYLGFLLAHLILIRGLIPIGPLGSTDLSPRFGKHLVFYLFGVVWLGDTAAYHVGKAWGRIKMAPVLSPKKTMEGLVAALIGGSLASQLFAPILGEGFRMEHRIALGLLLPLLGQMGDLTESIFKRSADIKDSGTLIPGHGGFFDRVDSILFTVPFLYYYVKIFIW